MARVQGHPHRRISGRLGPCAHQGRVSAAAGLRLGFRAVGDAGRRGGPRCLRRHLGAAADRRGRGFHRRPDAAYGARPRDLQAGGN